MKDYDMIPQIVFIGSQAYKIHLQDGVVNKPENVVCNGLCIDATKTILLDLNLEPATLYMTLLHELIHAIHEEYAIEDGASEERVTSVLSVALFNLLVDNPELEKVLSKGIQEISALKAKQFNG